MGEKTEELSGFIGDGSQVEKLYLVKMHYKNVSSESIVYAAFDNEKQQYIVICEHQNQQYQDATKRCQELKEEEKFSNWLKVGALNSKLLESFKASQYRNQNIVWRLISGFYSRYSVDLSALLPDSPDISPEEPVRIRPGTHQSDENGENHVARATDSGGSSKNRISITPPQSDSGYDDTRSGGLFDADEDGEYTTVKSGAGLLGLAGLIGGAGVLAYKIKWQEAEGDHQEDPVSDTGDHQEDPVSDTVVDSELSEQNDSETKKELDQLKRLKKSRIDLLKSEIRKLEFEIEHPELIPDKLKLPPKEDPEDTRVIKQEELDRLKSEQSFFISFYDKIISEDVAQFLVQNTTLNNLSLHKSEITQKAATILAQSQSLESISFIGSDNKLSEGAAQALAQSQSLEEISFWETFNKKVFQALVQCKSLKRVSFHDKISKDEAQALAQSQSLKQITFHKHDSDAELKEDAAQALAQSQSLEWISLFEKELSEGVARALAKCKSLKKLDLSDALFSEESAEALAQSSLEDISLSNAGFSEGVAQALAKFRYLNDLSIRRAILTLESAKALAKSKSLRYVFLGRGVNRDGAARALIAPWWYVLLPSITVFDHNDNK